MPRRKAGPWWRFIVMVLKPLLLLITRRDWRGTENLPRTGGFILAANHMTYVDPVMIGHLCWDNRRIPRFMAKAELFSTWGLGTILRGAKQIAVYRRSPDASLALRDAVAALKEGHCVVIYPEGTTTRDPDYWPMLGKTGVARLAMLTGAPVVPLAQWGAHRIYDRYSKKLRLRRTDIRIRVGPPVDLAEFMGREPTVENLRLATDRIMSAIREQLAELRGEPAPDYFFDPRSLRPVSDDDRRSA